MLAPARTTRGGRPRKKGARPLSPTQMAEDRRSPGTRITLRLYGKRVRVWFKSVDALWYASAAQQLLRIVVVRDPSGRRRDDCFFSTDRSLTPTSKHPFSASL